ncbi:hypothetical protein P280DRAFT_515112 [Massarina eburnea CBS 473.64]|uniref:F-box domain-containing protein n=1 Tax=Massarina eburnea CBS 473.64 TaxID=1395130 RepID=A0A6A6SD80_9PLEO|nr:hypothetical protein P280DRAFT_515112 [Massarina eburnea CBS 473.64]
MANTHTPSAKTQVITTPELLETVLLQLPPLSLLTEISVSHFFHTTIISSPHLQQRLFFRASPSSTQRREKGEWSLNPVLRSRFLPWFVLPSDHSDMDILDGLPDAKGR